MHGKALKADSGRSLVSAYPEKNRDKSTLVPSARMSCKWHSRPQSMCCWRLVPMVADCHRPYPATGASVTIRRGRFVFSRLRPDTDFTPK